MPRTSSDLRPALPKTHRDASLARHLYTILERDLELAALDNLQVFVRDGVVTLHGLVRSDADRRLILLLVEQTPGVHDVVDRLHLLPGAFPSDPAMPS